MNPLGFVRFAMFLALVSTSVFAQPLWWSTRGAVVGQADDYAAANLGQLKSMSTAAAFEMNARLPGGAGTTINDLISSWCQPVGVGVIRDDFVVLTVGQLKYVSKPFYDKLNVTYPWTTSTSDDDDYAAVNLGQLKYVFSFTIAGNGDSDADGLLDTWEIVNFGNLTAQLGSGDADADGLSNLAEYIANTAPFGGGAAATEVSATTLGLLVYSP